MEPTTWIYNHRTVVHFGPGVLAKLPDIAALYSGDKKIMLVTYGLQWDVADRVNTLLGGSEKVVVFDKVEPNPTAAVIHEGADMHREKKCGLIVGLGGGSPIDTAKGIAIMRHSDGNIADYLTQRKPWGRTAEPVIAIPTTAGTGTEVNANLVATIPEGNAKIGAAPPCTWPVAAIADPELTLSLPQDQTGSTGLDALSHALEALWAVRRQPLSDMNAYEAIPIIMKWLPVAYKDGSNIEARTNMLYASMLASLAFGSTGTAAVHAMSYYLTTNYGLPHGFACAFTMAELLEFNFPTFNDERKSRLLFCLGATDEKEAVAKVKQFCVDYGTPARLSDFGASEADIPALTAATNPVNLKNNARPASPSDLDEIWRKKL